MPNPGVRRGRQQDLVETLTCPSDSHLSIRLPQLGRRFAIVPPKESRYTVLPPPLPLLSEHLSSSPSLLPKESSIEDVLSGWLVAFSGGGGAKAKESDVNGTVKVLITKPGVLCPASPLTLTRRGLGGLCGSPETHVLVAGSYNTWGNVDDGVACC